MKIRILTGVAALLLIAGVIGSIMVLRTPAKSHVTISRDSEVLYSLDLTREKDRRFVIPYGDSGNTVEIRDGRIRVAEAACPDKTCVKTGWLQSSAMPIVCLPNHLVIAFDDDSGDIDAIAE